MRNGTAKLIDNEDVERVELLGANVVVYARDGVYSTADDDIRVDGIPLSATPTEEDISDDMIDIPEKFNLGIELGSVQKGTGHPLTAMERYIFKLEREEVEGIIVLMPDGLEWKVRRHIDGILYLLTRVSDDMVGWGVWRKSSNTWLWFENKPKREKQEKKSTKGWDGGKHAPDPDFPEEWKKGPHDSSSCCGTRNAHINNETGDCRGCRGMTVSERDKLRIQNGLNPIGEGTYPVWEKEGAIVTFFTKDEINNPDNQTNPYQSKKRRSFFKRRKK